MYLLIYSCIYSFSYLSMYLLIRIVILIFIYYLCITLQFTAIHRKKSVVSTDFHMTFSIFPDILRSKVLHLFQKVPGSSHVLLLLTCLDCYVVANPWGKGLEPGTGCKGSGSVQAVGQRHSAKANSHWLAPFSNLSLRAEELHSSCCKHGTLQYHILHGVL